MPDRKTFGRWAQGLALLPGLLITPSAAFAAIIEYTLTFDGVIHNPNGSWGGNIGVAAAREANLSLIYQYTRAEDGSSELYTIQLLDNTRGLTSARLFARSRLKIRYDAGADQFSGASGASPGGFLAPDAEGEFGDLGDPFPSGPAFDALVNAGAVQIVYALAAADGDEVSDQDLQSGSFVFSSRALPDPALDLLHCPGDVNGDAVPDLVVVTTDGQVTMQALDGTLINAFPLDVGEELIDLELIPDTNGNGAPELAALRRGSTEAEVRDLLTSGLLGTIAFDPALAPVDLEIMADRNGNAIPELALLGFDPITRDLHRLASAVEARDAMGGDVVHRVDSVGWSVPKDLDIQDDSNGNGEPEVAVLGDHLNRTGGDHIRISDVESGATAREIWLGRHWNVLRQERVGDINGNGSEDVAVLRVAPPRRVNVQLRDASTRQWLGSVGFAANYPPQRMLAIPDTNGNGASELVVFGSRFDGSNQKAVIKDSRTGARLRTLWFDRNFPGQAFADCGDINGNGAHELALLGERAGDGRRKVTIKDSGTGEGVAEVWF